MTGLLTGKAAIITGANQGLGLAIAKAYLAEGASLFLCARDGGKLFDVIDSLPSNSQQKVFGEACDVSKKNDVERMVEYAIEKLGTVQILVNNAGIYGPFGKLEEVDWEDWVQAIETNLMGSVLMARAILPHLKSNKYGKIIQLSGGGATKPLPRISAYAASKAAVVRFAETLAQEVKENNIDVNSIAPGALNTRMLDMAIEAGRERVGENFYQTFLEQKKNGRQSLKDAADLAVYLGSSQSDGLTGKLISAVWDPWEDFEQHRGDLDYSDVYTLRRVIPSDFGFKW
jgi:NAD(P)-dependent dehydrogenase (short-subunit alcohol dehydrogenase family)